MNSKSLCLKEGLSYFSWEQRCSAISLNGYPEALFWIVNLQDISLQEAEEAKYVLDAETLKKAERFKFQEDSFRCLLSHAFLRMRIGELTGQLPQKLSLLRAPYGKPYLKCGSVQFNLSHTKKFAFFAVHPSHPIGVDIEQHSPILERDLFLRSWCAEEAYLKSLGTGFSPSRPTIRLVNTSPDDVDSFLIEEIDIQVYNRSAPDSILAVCVPFAPKLSL